MGVLKTTLRILTIMFAVVGLVLSTAIGLLTCQKIHKWRSDPERLRSETRRLFEDNGSNRRSFRVLTFQLANRQWIDTLTPCDCSGRRFTVTRSFKDSTSHLLAEAVTWDQYLNFLAEEE